MNTGANILDGSALARNGAVTLQDNAITNCISSGIGSGPPPAVPEPSTLALLASGLAALVLRGRARFAMTLI